MKLRGYVKVEDGCNGIDGYEITGYPMNPCDHKNAKIYTFIIDVPHNLTELKTVEELEEVK